MGTAPLNWEQKGALLIKGRKGEEEIKIASIVLAGGQGTRLFPLTQTRCKPAVSFGGRYRLIDVPLSNSLNSHIFRIYVLAQYFASDLYQHIIGTFPTELFQTGDIKLLCPEERPDNEQTHWYKGTADAVRKNLHHFLASPAEYFLILSGDQLYNTHFSEMLAFAKKTRADLVIASLPVLEAEAKRMGLLKLNASDEVTEFFEKPSDPAILKRFELSSQFLEKKKLGKRAEPHYLGSMGIYVFKREALVSILKEPGDDFGRHIIPLQVQKGRTYGYVFDGYWEDIGTVSSYYQANLALLSNSQTRLNVYDELFPIYTQPHQLPSAVIRGTILQHSLVSQGSIIEAKEITNSILGVRTCVKKGSVIRNSIIMGNQFYTPPTPHSPPLPPQFHIGENCQIEKAIIDEHVLIGNNVKLINQKGLLTYDGNGIYIRDGIIIVTTGTTLPDGFVF